MKPLHAAILFCVFAYHPATHARNTGSLSNTRPQPAMMIPSIPIGTSYFQVDRTMGSYTSNKIKLSSQTNSLIDSIAGNIDKTSPLFYVLFAVSTVGFLTMTTGSIYAAVTKNAQLGWGIASTVWFGLNSLGHLAFAIGELTGEANSSTIAASIGACLLNLGLLGLGIYNIRDHVKRKAKVTSIAPWMDYSRRTKAFSGGISLTGKF